VEEKGRKEGEVGWPTTDLWSTDHAWPPLKPYFHPPLHPVPIMLTSLTKSIKNKVNFFHPFPKFYLLFFWNFWFYIMQWWSKHDVKKGVNKNSGWKGER
jgi:hypothetical protein